jgi:hypothetical protein
MMIISSFSREQFSLKWALAYLEDLHNVRMLHKLHGGDFSLDLQVIKSTKRKTIKSRSTNNTCNSTRIIIIQTTQYKICADTNNLHYGN